MSVCDSELPSTGRPSIGVAARRDVDGCHHLLNATCRSTLEWAATAALVSLAARAQQQFYRLRDRTREACRSSTPAPERRASPAVHAFRSSIGMPRRSSSPRTAAPAKRAPSPGCGQVADRVKAVGHRPDSAVRVGFVPDLPRTDPFRCASRRSRLCRA